MEHRQLPNGWDKELPSFPADAKGLATRDSSAKVENAIAKNVPWLMGGSADLAPSTKTLLTFESATGFQPGSYSFRNLHFGIREHAMSAIINGMSLTKVRPFGATFFVFTDYMRGGMRLSAIMGIPVIYILTHDSLGVGEDGPTHQPIEHLAIARATPGLITLRPADANEVIEAWKVVMQLAARARAAGFDAPGAAHARPRAIRSRRRACARRVRACRKCRGASRCAAAGHGQRSFAVR